MKCAVANCASENKRQACDISFFSFPTDAKLAKKWIQFCRRAVPFNPKTSYVCMKHFNSDDIENKRKFEMGFAKKRLLKRGVVPTIYLEYLNKPQRMVRAEHYEYKRDFSELLQQSETDSVDEVDQIRRNWQTLRDQYRRELKRQLLHGVEPTWIFFNEMSFIRKYMRIQEVNKGATDSESDSESNRDRNEIQTQLEFYQAGESITEQQSQTNQPNDAILCDTSAKEELKHCRIKVETDSEEEDAATKCDDQISLVEKTLDELLKIAVPNQRRNVKVLASSTPNMKTALKKRSHEPNRSNIINAAGNKADDVPLKRRNLKDTDCSTHTRLRESHDKEEKNTPANELQSKEFVSWQIINKSSAKSITETKSSSTRADDIQKPTHSKDTTTAFQRPQCQLNQLPVKIEIEDSSDEDNIEANDKEERAAQSQVNGTGNSLTSRTSMSVEVENAMDVNKTEATKVDVGQEDDDYHFLMSILPYLRRTRLDRKLTTRMNIMQAVMEGMGCNM